MRQSSVGRLVAKSVSCTSFTCHFLRCIGRRTLEVLELAVVDRTVCNCLLSVKVQLHSLTDFVLEHLSVVPYSVSIIVCSIKDPSVSI